MEFKTIFKKDHYETDLILESFNCKVLEIEQDFIFLKVQDPLLKQLETLKSQINNIVHRNPEYYCDSKKIIKNGKTFEETLKVKNGDFKFEIGQTYNLKLLVYSIWIGKSSYGPLIKVIQQNQIESTSNSIFLQEPQSDSDEEIQTHYEIFSKINLKNKSKSKRKVK
jgi:hypothetical protein